MCGGCGSAREQVEQAEQAAAPRRGFFRWLGGAALALVVLPATLVRAKKVGLPLSKLPKLGKVGGSMHLRLNGHEVLLVRETEASVRAINPTCTHQKCAVKFSDKSGKLHCDCHKSAYDLGGKVLEGPAPKPLQTYPSTFDGERIVLDLPEAS